ncbi:nijmegen breakage syndrome 1 protein isoform X3 [Cynara cardunculus var. scolymus]|uniref:nijmegen breakage syndrome 1 protein isoform X3 n=1 Tax=Cynara cardunculus var. scolymus TaxID=59895 RepID=UPI000D62E16D|nr:nijmegen breakage syndrome 1 protein isoform X3 [Cynara cardunculus var. scolymus]
MAYDSVTLELAVETRAIEGEENYYLFSKGSYKVGRKGCDIIVNKDKGVSRVHAEIVIDTMVSMDNMNEKLAVKSSKIRIKDCSKYGTFIKKPHGSKEKVNELPRKETTLDDADLVSFGTGTATYRFSYVPLVFFPCGLEPARSKELQEKLSSIEKRIGTEIPSCSSYAPTLTLQGVSVKVADPESRENCLSGYTFLLESSDMYKVKEKLQLLLEAFGAKVVPVEEFVPHSQGLEDDENNHVVHVISVGEGNDSECSHNLTSLPKVSEINLICATLSGRLDPSVLVSPPVLVTSSCSTDETVVADSDPEVEITSVHTSAAIRKIESVEDEKGETSVNRESIQYDNEVETIVHSINSTKPDDQINTTTDNINAKANDDQVTCLHDRDDGISTRDRKTDDAEIGNSDVIFSQDLIIRDTNLLPSLPSPTKNQVVNFKRFKKMETESGNSFYNLVPFSKHPYKGSEYENEGVAESLKEEKKRKQREAVAEDLFNNAKAKQRGAAGFLKGLFT